MKNYLNDTIPFMGGLLLGDEFNIRNINQRKFGVIISYLTLGFNILIGLVYTPFMIFKLGDGQYGIFSLVNSLISFITILDLGFSQTLVRYISKTRTTGDTEEEYRLNGFFMKLYLVIAVIAFVIGFSIVILYPQLVSKSFLKEEISLFRTVLFILLINVCISFPLSVFSATLNAYEEFFLLKLTNLLMTVLKYFVMFLLLLFGYKLVAIAVVVLIFSLVTQCIYVFYSVRVNKIKFSFSKIETNLTKEIIYFSFFIFLNLIIDFLYSNTDKLILGAVAGTVSVSVYSIGIYFSQYFTELSCAMSGVFLPKIMDLYHNDQTDKISDLFNQVGRLQMALLFFVLGGYICLGREFINLWVGSTYKDSYLIGIIIMLPSIVPLTQNIGISIIRAMNIHKYRSYMYIVIAIINVVISIPLAITYGGIGSAIGTSIATFLGQIFFMNWFYARKVQINIKKYWNSFGKFLLMTIFVLVVVSGLRIIIPVYSWTTFVLMVLLFSIIYVVAYWLTVANKYEKELLLSILRRL